MKFLSLALLAVALVQCTMAQTYAFGTDSTISASTQQWTNAPTQGPTQAPGGNVDRQCGGDLTNLWLDVVVVVDNSKGMTNEGLTEVAANIVTVFGNGTRIGTGSSDPRNTRVAVVTYNGAATVAADLNKFQSIDDMYATIFTALAQVSESEESYLAKGIAQAEAVLQAGRTNNYRSNYKRLVVVYASAYKGEGELDPIPVSERLKASGVAISTVGFDQDGDEALLNALGEVASPGLSYSSKDLNLVGEIQGAALQTNCFCPNLWMQYKADFNNEASYKFGVCLRAATISSSWMAAKFACQNLAHNGYLATEFDGQKQSFNFNLAKNTTAFQQPYIYHIGLNFVNGGFYWQQPTGYPLKQMMGFTNWNPGYPKQQTSNTGVVNQQSGSQLSVGWQNVNPYSVAEYYICEVASCDTDLYCA